MLQLLHYQENNKNKGSQMGHTKKKKIKRQKERKTERKKERQKERQKERKKVPR